MNTVVKNIKDLNSSERNEIVNFLIGCFSENPDYKNSVYSNPDLDSCVLLYQDKELVGHVGITRRKIIQTDRPYVIAGIGDVAIKPELRHSGLGIQIMNELNKVLKSQDYDVGILFCHPKLHDFYAKSGWYKKEVGKVFAERKGVLEDQRLTYLLPLKLDKTDMDIWNSEDIAIGIGNW